MIVQAPQETIPLNTDADGVIRVGGTRVTLETVVDVFRAGSTPEQIVDQFPSLVIADVYAVIAYILRHEDAVDAYLADCGEEAAMMRAKAERISPQDEIRDRLMRRHQQRRSNS